MGMPETLPSRAAARSVPDDAPSIDGLHQVLCIRAANMVFCLDLEHVERVLSLVLLQPVPQGPDHLAGLMNLHGRNIPVIDLSVRIGLTDVPAYTANTPLIICNHEGQETGLIVSEILGIESIRQEAAQMTDEFDQSPTAFFASLNTRHGLALLLDIEQTLAVDWTGLDLPPLLPPAESAL